MWRFPSLFGPLDLGLPNLKNPVFMGFIQNRLDVRTVLFYKKKLSLPTLAIFLKKRCSPINKKRGRGGGG
ncbi:hypothetical protein, partial [Enterobacter intestinihominis]